MEILFLEGKKRWQKRLERKARSFALGKALAKDTPQKKIPFQKRKGISNNLKNYGIFVFKINETDPLP